MNPTVKTKDKNPSPVTPASPLLTPGSQAEALDAKGTTARLGVPSTTARLKENKDAPIAHKGPRRQKSSRFQVNEARPELEKLPNLKGMSLISYKSLSCVRDLEH